MVLEQVYYYQRLSLLERITAKETLDRLFWQPLQKKIQIMIVKQIEIILSNLLLGVLAF